MAREAHRLVFIDETSVNTKMVRARGRSLRGRRLRATAPFGHWKTQTFIAGLRCHGLTAPWVIDGPMNKASFETYVETQLAPTLQRGDVVIMDNLSSHKSERVKRLLGHRGAWALFLPPYSPDLNPCMDGSCVARALWTFCRTGRLRPCIRRLSAAIVLRTMMNVRWSKGSHSIERA